MTEIPGVTCNPVEGCKTGRMGLSAVIPPPCVRAECRVVDDEGVTRSTRGRAAFRPRHHSGTPDPGADEGRVQEDGSDRHPEREKTGTSFSSPQKDNPSGVKKARRPSVASSARDSAVHEQRAAVPSELGEAEILVAGY